MHIVFECELVVKFTPRMSRLGLARMETPDKTKSTSGGFTDLDLLITELLILVRIQYHAQVIAAGMYRSQLLLLLLLLLLLKVIGSARLRERGLPYLIYTLSFPKTPAKQYQPIDRKKRKEKIVEDYSRNRAA